MKRLLTIFLSLTFVTTAWAQPDPTSEPPPPPPPPTPDPVPDPDPAPPPPPPANNTPDPAAQPDPAPRNGGMHHKGMKGMHHKGMHGDRKRRPEGFTVGLGFGYNFPDAAWRQPNITTARFRLPSGITIEPLVELSKTSDKNEVGNVETTDDANELTLAALVRFPVMSSKKLDLIAAGGAAVSSATTDPEGANNAITSTLFSLNYGLGVEYWYNAHWNISVTTVNPLITYSKVKQDNVGGDASTTSSTFGLIFEPSVIAMLHLFFE